MVVDSDNLTVDSWRLIRGACFNPVVKLKIAMSHSCLCSSMFGHFLYPNFKRSIPAKKLIFQLQVPLQTLEQSPSTKGIFKQQGYHSKHENRPSMYLASSHSQNNSKTENPSGATAVFVGHVHHGPRRDQLLDHGAVAVQCRHMQRRVASGAEAAMRKAEQLRHRGETKHRNGMFVRVAGQNCECVVNFILPS